MKKLISIVIPMLNESGNIPRLYASLQEVIHELGKYEFEIILVDDGSKDASWNGIMSLAEQDPRVRGIRFTRNFGTQSATSAGYDHARGDAVITLDADLQHPPYLIPAMITAWEQGFLIVCPRRTAWKESFLKRVTSWLHYRFLETYSVLRIPRNVNDFRLIDRSVLTIVNSMREQPRFLRGMLAWVGFQPTFLEYQSPQRLVGVTGYTWKKLFNLAIDGVVSFTTFPLILAGYVGVVITVLAAALACWSVVYGELTQPVLLLFFTGLQFFILWIVGEYIARLNEQVRGRPLFVIEQKINGRALLKR